MNLNYSLTEIANWMDAKVIGDSNKVVKQVSFDSRSPLVNKFTLFFALKGTKSHGIDYVADFLKSGGELIVVENEIKELKATQLVVSNTLVALQVLAIHHRKKFNIPVIGITGSNGKTTVKEWLFHTLKFDFNIVRSPKSYNSQIGVPMSVLEMTDEHTLAIFEAGISEVGEMKKLAAIIQPTIGVYTGIGDAHQTGFKSLKEKEAEKRMLFEKVEVLFSPESVENADKIEIPFILQAAILNAQLVKITAQYLGLNTTQIDRALLTLPTISMRMEKMEGVNGNILINDAYTFDERGLEIGLKTLLLNTQNRSRVLVLAPDLQYEVQKSLNEIIKASDLDTLVWIHPQAYPFPSKFKCIHIKSVEDFIQRQLTFKDSIILFSGSRSQQLERSIPLYQLRKHITRLEIDLSAIRHNLTEYRKKLAKKSMILAMVKAQSYGSGSVEMGKFLSAEKIDALGVAYADEGVLLRKAGITLPILVMNPEEGAFDNMIDYHLEPSIYSLNILDQFLNRLILKNIKNYPIHLKIDTGMHRLGFVNEDFNELIATLNAQPEVYVKGVLSHLATADDASEIAFTNQQIATFQEATKTIEKGIGYSFIKHIANSAAAINNPNAQFDMVRVGIGLFGLMDNVHAEFEQSLSFKTQISQIKIIKIGDSVGYGRRFRADKKTTIAVIPVGYADGLFRGLSNGKWQVKIGDQFAPIVGSICMDMCMVDVTNVICNEGDEVMIFGWDQSIYEMANALQTIPYEIISSISSRVHRVYVD
ncbi:alanine racemase [Putridiphycobacter roseus]|uniref:Alanine racemase n=1 Tax=Putridiphycobacter roseus TaxID=2219161 RepID=A0A2W1NCD5_9FLAO|nr:alanine racemase [Putridiphycobacter roseus]PZE17025.1 alanine racemase [Putridiphycobacter roseus]